MEFLIFFGRHRGLDNPSSVGTTPPWGEDLNEWKLWAEFGSQKCR
jgi:hypothetical protein